MKANKHPTIQKISIALKVSIGSVHGHGFVKKFNVWVPHELNGIHPTGLNVCVQLTKREENDTFLKRMLMGDEK